MIVKTILFVNSEKAFNSLNFKKFVKPIVLFISIILIISTLSFLAATVVQDEPENNKTISIYAVNTNSSTPTPIPTPITRPTPDSTRTFVPTRILPLIPDQTPDPTITPTLPPSSPTPSTPTSTPTPTIITASPTPNPTITPSFASSANLAPIPNGWSTATNGLNLAIGGVSNDVLDYNVQYNGNPTIRQDPVGTTNNYMREVDGPYITVKPGDHIVFSVWIKTSASTLGDKSLYSGARFGIDFYGAKGAITGTASPDGSPMWTPWGGWEANTELNYVHWGTSTWTQKIMSFTVASGYPAYPGYAGNWNYASGQWITPTAIIPCLQVWSSIYGTADGGSAWFANPTLYINP